MRAALPKTDLWVVCPPRPGTGAQPHQSVPFTPRNVLKLVAGIHLLDSFLSLPDIIGLRTELGRFSVIVRVFNVPLFSWPGGGRANAYFVLVGARSSGPAGAGAESR